MGGFNIVPLAQKAKTSTIIVDSDLNLGNYDLLCTDAKGDTAEFDEFEGGVGNFDSTLTRGNAQINGNINTAGTITASGVINANGGINGNASTAGGLNRVFNVTPSSNIYTAPYVTKAIVSYPVLPFIEGVLYTGSLTVYGTKVGDYTYCGVGILNENNTSTSNKYASTSTITFNRIKSLTVYKYTYENSTTHTRLCSIPIMA